MVDAAPLNLLDAKQRAMLDYFDRHPVRIASAVNALGVEIWNSERHENDKPLKEIAHAQNENLVDKEGKHLPESIETTTTTPGAHESQVTGGSVTDSDSSQRDPTVEPEDEVAGDRRAG